MLSSIIENDLSDYNVFTTKYQSLLLAKYIVGSRAYGLSTPESDIDYRGIFILPMSYYLRMEPPVTQVTDQKNDCCFYSLKRFLELVTTANPNIIELLFMPNDCRVVESPLLTPLLESRDRFVTKLVWQSHFNYVTNQMRRAKGLNNWINNPQPEEPPRQIDYCWFVPRQRENGPPFRPVPFSESGLKFDHTLCTALEKTENVYRLYSYDHPTQGVFDNGQIVCLSIPKEDENLLYVGLLIYHPTSYNRAARNHLHYWTWRKERNESRCQIQEKNRL